MLHFVDLCDQDTNLLNSYFFQPQGFRVERSLKVLETILFRGICQKIFGRVSKGFELMGRFEIDVDFDLVTSIFGIIHGDCIQICPSYTNSHGPNAQSHNLNRKWRKMVARMRFPDAQDQCESVMVFLCSRFDFTKAQKYGRFEVENLPPPCSNLKKKQFN